MASISETAKDLERTFRDALKVEMRPLQDEVQRLRAELYNRNARKGNRLGFSHEGAVELGQKVGDLLWQAPPMLENGGIRIPYLPAGGASYIRPDEEWRVFRTIEIRVQ